MLVYYFKNIFFLKHSVLFARLTLQTVKEFYIPLEWKHQSLQEQVEKRAQNHNLPHHKTKL